MKVRELVRKLMALPDNAEVYMPSGGDLAEAWAKAYDAQPARRYPWAPPNPNELKEPVTEVAIIWKRP